MNNPPLPTVPGGQAPAQPAAPQPVAQTAPPPLAPEAVVDVTVDGKAMKVPFSDVVKGYQIESSARRRMSEVEAMRTKYKDQIDFAERFSQTARSNPELAAQETEALIERVSGRKLTRAQAAAQQNTTQPESYQANDAPQDRAAINREIDSIVRARLSSDPELQELRQMRSELRTRDALSEIGRVLDGYPHYKANPEARMNAELVMGAMLRNNPDRPLDEIARELHSRDMVVLERALNQTRDQRVQTAQATAAVPPNGTPQLTEQAEPFTRKDLKNGRLRAAMEAAYAVGRRVVQ